MPAMQFTTTGKERDQGRDDHLGHDAVTEPDDDKRRDRYLRYCLERHDVGIDGLFEHLPLADAHPDEEPDHRADRKAGEDFPERNAHMRVKSRRRQVRP